MNVRYILPLVLVLCLFGIGSGEVSSVQAADQMKTEQFFVASFPSQVSAATSSPFSVYIGDDLTGVTTPLKSMYYLISGMYTGSGGTIEFQIDADVDSSQIFVLPTVSSPTYFQLLYKDPSLAINPTTAGTFTYTFNVIPTGVTLSSLSAKAVMTYRRATNSGCPDGSSTNQRIKTEQFFVASFPSQVSAATSSPFSVYIGDDLTGVTTPLKSMYYLVSGIYTGSGTLEFMIDADADTSRVFTLPTVASPTYFQLLYKDPAYMVSPTTAGTYAYAFHAVPVGVTLSSLSVKTVMTYQYAPPTCTPTGELYSVVFDTTGSDVDGPSYNSLSWKGTLNTGKVRLRLATATSSAGPWSYLGPEPGCDTATSTDADWYVPDADTPLDIGCFSSHEGQRYFRYELQICKATDCTSTAGMTSPSVTDVIINWSP